MKKKLTITIDAELLPKAKRYARSRGVSLSSFIEQSLREVAGEDLALLRHPMARPVQAGRPSRSALRRAGPEVSLMLLDTDILIDLALDRRPHAQAAADLLDRIEHGTLTAFIAWHTVSNFYYLVSPSRGRRERIPATSSSS